MQDRQLESLTADGEFQVASEAFVGPAVSVRGLSKRYGDVAAVDGLTLTLERGTITGFLGPNGAGKTTTSGDFDPGRSGRNHLRTIALATSIGYERVEELLELVELERAADRPVRTYSLGMRQRLGLAAALLGDPELLVLDEPANGLDPAGIAWLRGFLHHFAADGRTVLISSHVLAEVAQTVQTALIINGGRLVGQLELDQLQDGARSLETAYLELTGALV